MAKIRYSFYEDGISAPTVFNLKSVYTWKLKLITFSKEMRRRLSNIDETHTEEEVVEIAKKFIQKMLDLGYEEVTRMEVLKFTVIRHLRQVEEGGDGDRLYTGCLQK